MSNKKKTIYISLAFVILLVTVSFAYNYLTDIYENNSGGINVSDGEIQEALDFTVYDEDNNEVSLYDYIGNKNVVVNFWASWCPPCKAEMSYFEDAINDYSDENVEILMVNLADGQRETKEKAKQFIEEEGYNMDIVYDLDMDASTTYSLYAVPRTLFIDINGDIIYDHSGLIIKEALYENIDSLIEKK